MQAEDATQKSQLLTICKGVLLCKEELKQYKILKFKVGVGSAKGNCVSRRQYKNRVCSFQDVGGKL